MKRAELETILKDMNIDGGSISFYVDEDGNDADDSIFGTCDLTGEEGSIVGCRARTLDGASIVYFEAGEWLVGGALGRIAGAF